MVVARLHTNKTSMKGYGPLNKRRRNGSGGKAIQGMDGLQKKGNQGSYSKKPQDPISHEKHMASLRARNTEIPNNMFSMLSQRFATLLKEQPSTTKDNCWENWTTKGKLWGLSMCRFASFARILDNEQLSVIVVFISMKTLRSESCTRPAVFRNRNWWESRNHVVSTNSLEPSPVARLYPATRTSVRRQNQTIAVAEPYKTRATSLIGNLIWPECGGGETFVQNNGNVQCRWLWATWLTTFRTLFSRMRSWWSEACERNAKGLWLWKSLQESA